MWSEFLIMSISVRSFHVSPNTPLEFIIVSFLAIQQMSSLLTYSTIFLLLLPLLLYSFIFINWD